MHKKKERKYICFILHCDNLLQQQLDANTVSQLWCQWHFGHLVLCCGSGPVHCGRVSNIPGLCPWDANSPSPVIYIKNVSRLSNASCRHSHPGGTDTQNLYPTLSFMVTLLQQTLSKAPGYTLLSQPILHWLHQTPPFPTSMGRELNEAQYVPSENSQWSR